MFKASLALLILCAVLIFMQGLSFAYSLLDTESISLAMEGYFRGEVVNLNNVVGLDSRNKDDRTVYFGIDYSLASRLLLKKIDSTFYLKVERNGPYDYSAPLFIHHKLITSAGPVDEYRGKDLLPMLEEFWFDTPFMKNLRFKIGLYTYEVGNSFSLNGSYENYGFTISREWENFNWNFYYCRPELPNKERPGPTIEQEFDQGIRYNHNASNFFATDLKIKSGGLNLEPYAGMLVDYTSPGKRENLFSAPIDKDYLGTAGLALTLEQGNLSFKTELAHNFGVAKTTSPEYKNIAHTGYMIYAATAYRMNKFTPSLQFLLCSGNKVTPDMALNADTTFTSGKNKAFSYYSPLNLNPGDSVSGTNSEARPIVAMGSGNGLNYGIARPSTFAAADYDNIILPRISLEFRPVKKLLITLEDYYLWSLERGVGIFAGEAKYLSRDLGNEVDLLIDYKLSNNVMISFLGGYFYPGKYYRQERDDTAGSLFSPSLRADGKANAAYQLEMSIEITF